MLNNTSKDILAFYLGQSPDSEGRILEDIWSWNYQKLEDVHNYIQWLFPLKEKSRFNWNAPVLNEEVIEAFRINETLKVNLIRSFKVMLKFYGFLCNEDNNGEIEISKSDEYKERKRCWIQLHNHNYLRITRILTSLSILGLDNYAQAFFQCLKEIYSEENQVIGNETFAYWKGAVEDSR